MKPLDPNPVTDAEIIAAFEAVMSALAVAGALLDIADERQVHAVFDACPLGDRASAHADFESWMSVLLDGTTGLDVRAPGAEESDVA